jgi:hypothetical protein
LHRAKRFEHTGIRIAVYSSETLGQLLRLHSTVRAFSARATASAQQPRTPHSFSLIGGILFFRSFQIGQSH